MTHLLDTNSCVDHLRHGLASKVTAKLAAAAPGSVVLCSVVVGELHSAHTGAYVRPRLSAKFKRFAVVSLRSRSTIRGA